jgi:hypothetical protein
MAERFSRRSPKLYLGSGQEFRGESILAVTKPPQSASPALPAIAEPGRSFGTRLLGGGPMTLFLILLKKTNPAWDVTVIERNRPPTRRLGSCLDKPWTAKSVDGKPTRITHSFRHWDDIDVSWEGNKITSGGHCLWDCPYRCCRSRGGAQLVWA